VQRGKQWIGRQRLSLTMTWNSLFTISADLSKRTISSKSTARSNSLLPWIKMTSKTGTSEADMTRNLVNATVKIFPAGKVFPGGD
jgi:hypothetical protein